MCKNITLCIKMYIIMIKNNETLETQPLFFSEGLLQAKQELKKFVLNEMKSENKQIILTFRYDLSDFENETVARFADQDGHSIEVIEISTKDNGIFWSSVERNIKVLNLYYLKRVGNFENIIEEKKKLARPTSKPIKIASEPSSPIVNSVRYLKTPHSDTPNMDKVFKELIEKVNLRKSIVEEDYDYDSEE